MDPQDSPLDSPLLRTIHDNLREVEKIGEKVFSIDIDGELPQVFVWEDHGLKIVVPAASLPRRSEIAIVALAAGRFVSPRGTQLVSGVYAIACSEKLNRPIELSIQHCVDLQKPEQAKLLSFMRAKCSQRELPYTFQHLDGGRFPLDSQYGSIVLEQFSMFCLGLKEGGNEGEGSFEQQPSLQSQYSQTESKGIDVPSLHYWAVVHTQLQQGSKRWMTVFTVSKDLEILVQNQKKRYRIKEYTEFDLWFEERKITLVLDKEQTKHNWMIVPKKHPCQIFQEQVDEYGNSSPVPPSCKISIYPLDGARKVLYYHVPVQGTRDEELSFLIDCELTSEQVPASYVVDDTPHVEMLFANDLGPVMESLSAVAEWYNLGLALGLTSGVLDEIERDGSNITSVCKRRMLLAWLQRKGQVGTPHYDLPSWQSLAKALRSETVALIQVADKIERDHHASV